MVHTAKEDVKECNKIKRKNGEYIFYAGIEHIYEQVK